MARFCSLFSSSSGNSTFLGSGNCNILIDAGVSAKRLTTALTAREIDPSSLKGIFITHEHSDHVNGLRVFATKYSIPVFATEGTISALEENGILTGKFPYTVIDEKGVDLGDIFVKPFDTLHDAKQSCAYQFTLSDGQKAAIATDLGKVTEQVKQHLIGCSLVMLESNHDVGMLQSGDYPYHLKRRILSDFGHLSNVTCSEMAAELVESGTVRLFLGHLSTQNNMPTLAYETNVSEILLKTGAQNNKDYILRVNEKENTSPVIRF